MKKVIFSSLLVAASLAGTAQQKEGKVMYERTMQMQIRMAEGDGPQQEMSRTRTDRFELNFANGQMVYKQMEDDIQDEGFGGGDGVMIRSIGGGGDDVTFCDFQKLRKVESREFFDKKFLIIDSIRRDSWKLGEETKTILNHICRKATSQRIGKRMTMSMDNGKMERKEITDTSLLVAWFTTDIPVPAGPEVQGQLPGLILELETNNGRAIYKAIEISPEANQKQIKEPTKGKKVSPDEFAIERNKMMDEMERNGGGNFRIRMN
jgi:GLPGLI family protein